MNTKKGILQARIVMPVPKTKIASKVHKGYLMISLIGVALIFLGGIVEIPHLIREGLAERPLAISQNIVWTGFFLFMAGPMIWFASHVVESFEQRNAK
jgi:hypothetical protein